MVSVSHNFPSCLHFSSHSCFFRLLLLSFLTLSPAIFCCPSLLLPLFLLLCLSCYSIFLLFSSPFPLSSFNSHIPHLCHFSSLPHMLSHSVTGFVSLSPTMSLSTVCSSCISCHLPLMLLPLTLSPTLSLSLAHALSLSLSCSLPTCHWLFTLSMQFAPSHTLPCMLFPSLVLYCFPTFSHVVSSSFANPFSHGMLSHLSHTFHLSFMFFLFHNFSLLLMLTLSLDTSLSLCPSPTCYPSHSPAFPLAVCFPPCCMPFSTVWMFLSSLLKMHSLFPGCTFLPSFAFHVCLVCLHSHMSYFSCTSLSLCVILLFCCLPLLLVLPGTQLSSLVHALSHSCCWFFIFFSSFSFMLSLLISRYPLFCCPFLSLFLLFPSLFFFPLLPCFPVSTLFPPSPSCFPTSVPLSGVLSPFPLFSLSLRHVFMVVFSFSHSSPPSHAFPLSVIPFSSLLHILHFSLLDALPFYHMLSLRLPFLALPVFLLSHSFPSLSSASIPHPTNCLECAFRVSSELSHTTPSVLSLSLPASHLAFHLSLFSSSLTHIPLLTSISCSSLSYSLLLSPLLISFPFLPAHLSLAPFSSLTCTFPPAYAFSLLLTTPLCPVLSLPLSLLSHSLPQCSLSPKIHPLLYLPHSLFLCLSLLSSLTLIAISSLPTLPLFSVSLALAFTSPVTSPCLRKCSPPPWNALFPLLHMLS